MTSNINNDTAETDALSATVIPSPHTAGMVITRDTKASPAAPTAVCGSGFMLCDTGQDMLMNLNAPTAPCSAQPIINTSETVAPGYEHNGPPIHSEDISEPVSSLSDNSFIYLNTGSEIIALALDENIIPGMNTPLANPLTTLIPEPVIIAESTPTSPYYFHNTSLLHHIDISKYITDILHY